MNAVWQISRRFGRVTEARTRSAVDYSITATLSVVPDPLDPLLIPIRPATPNARVILTEL